MYNLKFKLIIKIITKLIYFFKIQDTTAKACFSDISGNTCKGLLNKNITYSMCCCSIGSAWGDSNNGFCTPCPIKPSGKYDF